MPKLPLKTGLSWSYSQTATEGYSQTATECSTMCNCVDKLSKEQCHDMKIQIWKVYFLRIFFQIRFRVVLGNSFISLTELWNHLLEKYLLSFFEGCIIYRFYTDGPFAFAMIAQPFVQYGHGATTGMAWEIIKQMMAVISSVI